MNSLLSKKRLLFSLNKKLKISDRSLKESKNLAVKSQLYKKPLAVTSIYMNGGPKIIEIN
jgi:hypothetical protein